ncbi:MAG: FMN-binding protein [Thermodesulfobacteriota bacterium]
MPKGNSDHQGVCCVFGARLFWGCLLILGCAMTPPPKGFIDPGRLKDGIYEGSFRGGPNKATVSVSITDRRISRIVILEHQAWRGRKAETPIVERIIAAQATTVDAVSGATNSSRVIMNAVQNAVEKAYSQK